MTLGIAAQENEYWLERISGAYQSPLYTGDLQAHFQAGHPD